MSGDTQCYPVTSPETEPFWAGLRRNELLYQWCEPCGRVVFHPRAACPYCWRASLAWRKSAGRGHLYSFSETWPSRGGACRIFAIARLAEGFYMFAELQAQAGEASIGAAITTVYDAVAPDLTLAKYRLAA
jgi:hypothetical protein